jgi:hypothetical protein
MKQEIKIGVQGNDGTGDSIRDAFRKVNENFNEIYSIFGQGRITFAELADGTEYTGNQLIMASQDGSKLTARTLIPGTNISILANDTSVTIASRASQLSDDSSPEIKFPFNANLQPIGRLPDPSQTLVDSFNLLWEDQTTLDQLPVTVGYGNRNYVRLTSDGVIGIIDSNGNIVPGPVNARDEPNVPDTTNAAYDATLSGNYLSTEVLPRKNVVYRGGDTMAGPLYLNDHPKELAGIIGSTGKDDLQAATAFYVDNKTFTSNVNLYVSTSGDDLQTRTPAGKEGRFWNYAFKSIGSALLHAESLINVASQEPGPYKQRISYTLGPDQYFSKIQKVTLTGGNSTDTGYVAAYNLLQANREFIQAETIAYINKKYVNPFAYDHVTLTKKIDSLLTNISTDLVLGATDPDSSTSGTNYNSYWEGVSYIHDNPTSDGLIQWIETINFVRDQIIDFSYDTVALQAYTGQIIDAIIYDLLFKSNYQSIQAGIAFKNAGTKISADQLVSMLTTNPINITSASCNGSTVTLIFNTQSKILFPVGSEILVNATFTSKTISTDPVSISSVGNNSVVSFVVTSATTSSVSFSKGTLNLITDQFTVVGNIDCKNLVNLLLLTPEVRALPAVSRTSLIISNINVIKDYILTGTPPEVNYPAPLVPAVGYNVTGHVSAKELLLDNIPFIQAETLAFLASEYPNVIFTRSKYIRDVQYIVWSLVYDLMYGGNSQSVYIAKQNQSELNASEAEAYIAAIRHINILAQAIIQNGVLGVAYQQSVRQYRNDTLTNGNVASTSISTNITLIADILTNIVNVPSTITTPLVTTSTSELQTLFTAISNTRSVYTTGVNTSTSWFMNKFYPVIDTDTKQLKITRLFKVITDIIESGQVPATLPSYPSLTVTVNPNITPAMINQARTLLSASVIHDIAVDTNTFVLGTYGPGTVSNITYNQTLFKREIENIIISVCYDITFGGKTGCYRSSKQFTKIGTSNLITEDIFTHVRDFTKDYITGNITGDTTVNNVAELIGTKFDSVISFLNTSPAIEYDSSVVTKINLLTFTNNDTNNMYGKAISLRNLIIDNSTAIINSTISYVDVKFAGGYVYDESLCFRDLGYIIDAMSIDIITGGTWQAINSGKSFYKSASARTVAISGSHYIQSLDGLQFAKKVGEQVLNKETAVRYQSTPQITSFSTLASLPTASIYVIGDITVPVSVNAKTKFTDSFDTVLNILQYGISAAAVPSYGTGIWHVCVNNGGRGYVDQGAPLNNDIFPAKVIVGVGSSTVDASEAYASIVKYAPGQDTTLTILSIDSPTQFTVSVNHKTSGPLTFSVGKTVSGLVATLAAGSAVVVLTTGNTTNLSIGQTPVKSTGTGEFGVASLSDVDTVQVRLTKPGFFVVNEEVEFGETVRDLNITLFVESGRDYEDYPMRLPANVSIKGDEFRRTLVRPRDRISQSPWRKIFFYRDAIIDGLEIGKVNYAGTDYSPVITSAVTFTDTNDLISIVSQNVAVAHGFILNTVVTFLSINTTTGLSTNTSYYVIPVTSTTFKVASALNGTAVALTTDGTGTMSHRIAASLDGVTNTIVVTLSNNYQALLSWVGKVIADTTTTNNAKRGRAVIDSVSGNTFNCTVIYPFTTSGTYAPGTWKMFDTNNYGRHYLTDPLDVTSPAKNNKEIDVFLCNEGNRVLGMTFQGQGGFAMVLDPEGNIKTKSPYIQECSSFSQSNNYKRFAGGQFIDGFVGRLYGTITNVSSEDYGITITVVGETNSGLDVRPPQPPCSFYVRGKRYQIDDIVSFDANTKTVVLTLDKSTTYMYDSVTHELSYDDVKARRDVGYVINAAATDVILGTNYRSVHAGRAFLRSYSSLLIGSLQDLTVAGINKASDLANTYFSSISSGLLSNNIRIITGMLTGGVNASPELTWSSSVTADDNKAREIIQNNKDFIKTEISAWLASGASGYSLSDFSRYNVLTSERDVSYTVDAITYDIFYGGNSQTYDTAISFYYTDVNGIVQTVVPKEQTLCAAAHTRLKSILQDIIAGTPISKSAGNSLTQITANAPTSSASYVLKAGTLCDLIIDYIADGAWSSTPTVVFPTLPAGATTTAFGTVTTNMSTIASSVTNFLNNGANQRINLETGGNRSMLANDFAMFNDLAYGIIATNGAFTEQVCTFTYYAHTGLWANNGSNLRGVGCSNTFGDYGMRASGYDVTELPDSVNLANHMIQTAKVYRQGKIINEMEPTATTSALAVWIYGYDYKPTNGVALEIDHSVNGGVITKYLVTSIEYTTIQINTQIVLKLNLSTSGTGDTASSGLAKALYHGQLVSLRSTTNVKFINVDNVKPTRPSTALQYNDNLNDVYRIIAYNLTESTGDLLDPNIAVLQSDTDFSYYSFITDPASIVNGDPSSSISATIADGSTSSTTITVTSSTIVGTILPGHTICGIGFAGQTVSSITGPSGGVHTIVLSAAPSISPSQTVSFTFVTQGSKLGDTKIAVSQVNQVSVIDQINKGTYITAWSGRLHRVLRYVVPTFAATRTYVSYTSPTLVVLGNTGTIVTGTQIVGRNSSTGVVEFTGTVASSNAVPDAVMANSSINASGVLTVGSITSGVIISGMTISGGSISSGVYISSNITGGSSNGSTWQTNTTIAQSSTTITGRDSTSSLTTVTVTNGVGSPSAGSTITFGTTTNGYIELSANAIINNSADGTAVPAMVFNSSVLQTGSTVNKIVTFDVPYNKNNLLPRVDSYITITGNSNSAFNGSYHVTSVLDQTTLTIGSTDKYVPGMVVTSQYVVSSITSGTTFTTTANHNLVLNDIVTTDTASSGLAISTSYYAIVDSPTTFRLSSTISGSANNTFGLIVATGVSVLSVATVSGISTFTTNINHGLTAGAAFIPAVSANNLVAGTTYYYKTASTNTFTLSSTLNGTALGIFGTGAIVASVNISIQTPTTARMASAGSIIQSVDSVNNTIVVSPSCWAPVGSPIRATLAASVDRIDISSGGTGYDQAPLLTIVGGSPTLDATATCTVLNGVINQVNVVIKGIGYTTQPTVLITPAPGTVFTGTPAILSVVLSTPVYRDSTATAGITLTQMSVLYSGDPAQTTPFGTNTSKTISGTPTVAAYTYNGVAGYSVTYTYATMGAALTPGDWYRIAGNSNTLYNGFAQVISSADSTHAALFYPYSPGTWGSGTTTIVKTDTAGTSSSLGISKPFEISSSYTLKIGYAVNTGGQVTTRISTCRATGHDFCDIGTGGYSTTNIPYSIYGDPALARNASHETLDEGVGRCFYVSTNQDGIFRVGKFFSVDQGTGTVTFSAKISLSNLNGIGFSRGVVVQEFSSDDSLTNNAAEIVPVQSAVRGYIDKRLGLDHGGTPIPFSNKIGPGYVPLNGTLAMIANLNMGNHSITGVSDPGGLTDAANQRYVQAQVTSRDSIYKLADVSITHGNEATSHILIYNGSAWINKSVTTTNGDVSITYNGTNVVTAIGSGKIVNSMVSATAAIDQTKLLLDNAGTTTAASIAGATGSRTLTTATLTFATQSTIPFATGTRITVSGFTTTDYNGTFVVTGGSTSTVTFAVSETAATPAVGNGTISALRGVASFNNTQFTTTSGWVSLLTSTSSTTGVTLSKLQQVPAGTLLGNPLTSSGPVTTTTPGQVVSDGDGIKNAPFTSSGVMTVTYNNASPSGNVYSVTAVATDGTGNTIVKTGTNGEVDVAQLNVIHNKTISAVTAPAGTAETTKLVFTTPGAANFLSAEGNGSAGAPVLVKVSGTLDVSGTSNALKATTITTGSALTAGTLIGDWTVPEDSNLTVSGGINASGEGLTASISRPIVRPSVLFDFSNARKLDPRITFARNSIGTYYNEYGVMKTAVANQPRFTYNPTTKISSGLLVEEERKNWLVSSAAFETSGGTINWSYSTGVSRTTSTTIAPDGTTAYQFTSANANGTITFAGGLSTGPILRTFSIWMKRISGTGNIKFTMDNNTPVVAGISEPTWYTITLTETLTRYVFTNSTSDHGISIKIESAGNTIVMWGAQLEDGGMETSYIPTTTTEILRYPDSVYVTGTNFTRWYNQNEGTFVISQTPTAIDTLNEVRDYGGISIESSNLLSIISLGCESNGSSSIVYKASGNITATTQFLLTGLTTTDVNSDVTQALAYKTDTVSYIYNGSLANLRTDSVATIIDTVNPMSRLDIGNEIGAQTISKIAYYPIRLSDAEIKSITAQ